MNSRNYWSLTDWALNSRKDPQASADHFFNLLKALPANQVRAAVACTLSREALIRAFEESASGDDRPLSGVPYLLKDLYDVAGWPTSASSLFLSSVRPAPDTSSALARSLDEAGGIFAGKTHLVEFAYGMEGSNSHFGDGVHPHFPERVSGGSSSGSVWAVASGLVPLASGSDTGGSVRVPAAYNGLYGVRVTPDHPWSKEGCFPLSPSFDTAGWFTRSAIDMTVTLDALLPTTVVHQSNFNGVDLLPNYEFADQELSAPHQRAIGKMPVSSDACATEAFAALPDLVTAYLHTSSNEAYQIHQEWHDPYKSRYDPQTWERIAKGKQWTKTELDRAISIKNSVKQFFKTLFAEYDFAVLPAAPVAAPLLGESTALRESHLALTTPASLGQIPVLTIPYFMDSGLSGGLQIMVPDLSPKSLAVWRGLLNG